MSIWGKILQGVKIGGAVAGAINPALGLIPVLIQGVENAFKAPGQGPLKKEVVKQVLVSYLAVHEGITAKEIWDDEALMSGVDMVIDGLVKIANAAEWKKKKPEEVQ